ncbi:Phosphatase impl1, chloroplastic, partial [Datura stramonium]|nr:Phosphatase impl1, chloroplastic [Datura stramonium]
MGRCLLSSTVSSFRICQLPRILLPCNLPKLAFSKSCSTHSKFFQHGFCTSFSTGAKISAALSEVGNKKEYSKIGADSTGSIPSSELLQVVEAAARTGAQVVMDAVNKPRNVTYKGLTDLVTDTDKSSEVAILEVVTKNFPDHLILGEEGGIIGDSSSDYLWCIDPLVIELNVRGKKEEGSKAGKQPVAGSKAIPVTSTSGSGDTGAKMYTPESLLLGIASTSLGGNPKSGSKMNEGVPVPSDAD